MNRIRDGYCCVVNPFNANQVSRVSLEQKDVDVIVFWTKNAQPMIEHITELNDMGLRYYFQYTVNGYPKQLEPNLPPLSECVATFRRLSEMLGPEKVIWRYDPIVLTDLTPLAYHAERFRQIAGELGGHTGRVVISVADEYRAAKGRLSKAAIGYNPAPAESEGFGDLMRALCSTAQDAGMEIFSCAEVLDLTPYGIQPGKCVDDAYIREAFGSDVTHKKDKSQRIECGCVASKDIGQYDTCLHGCQYCYATRSESLARRNIDGHFPDSPSILGRVECPAPKEEDDPQISLF